VVGTRRSSRPSTARTVRCGARARLALDSVRPGPMRFRRLRNIVFAFLRVKQFSNHLSGRTLRPPPPVHRSRSAERTKRNSLCPRDGVQSDDTGHRPDDKPLDVGPARAGTRSPYVVAELAVVAAFLGCRCRGTERALLVLTTWSPRGAAM